jgi:hypothetical protein
MIAKCKGKDCTHESQDTLYGKNNRVMTPCKDGFRCTVCGNTVRNNTGK